MIRSLIKAIVAGVSTQRDPNSDFWFPNVNTPVIYSNLSGDAAMRITTAYACVTAIASDIAKIPCILYSLLENGGKERAVTHWAYKLLRLKPNAQQNSFEFIEMLTGHLLLRGNAYALLNIGKNGVVVSMIPMHPDNVTPRRRKDGTLEYIWRRNGIDEIHLFENEVMHIRGFSLDGVLGISPIQVQADALNTVAMQNRYGSMFYRNNASPPGWIESPRPFKTEDDKLKFREAWQAAQGGGNQGKVAILENEMKYHQLTLTHTDMQYLESRKLSREEVAAIWRMPPHKVGIMDHATFGNIEEQNIQYVVDTLDCWWTRWQFALNTSLLTNTDYFFEFLREKLLQGKTIERYQAHHLALAGGWMTRNEVRILENLNPLPGLDQPLQALNMGNPGGLPQKALIDSSRSERVLINAARSILSKEQKFLTYRADSDDFEKHATEFYAKHIAHIEQALAINIETAREYCRVVLVEVIELKKSGKLSESIENWVDRAALVIKLGVKNEIQN